MPTDLYATYQTFLMGACVFALIGIVLGVAFSKVAPILETLWRKWLRLDGFGKGVTLCAIIGATLYGGSKTATWNRVKNDGADDNISLVGIYTQMSNDVQTAGGVTVTNQIPLVAVMTLNAALPNATPVSVRMSDTNQWTQLSQVSPWNYTDGTTNVHAFATAEDYSGYLYWWAGIDLPPVIIVSSEIKVTEFVEGSHSVTIGWTCSQPLATTFDVKWKRHTDAVWTTAATVSSNRVTVSGFWIDRDIDWRISSQYLEDGE